MRGCDKVSQSLPNFSIGRILNLEIDCEYFILKNNKMSLFLDSTQGTGMAAIKVTALGRPSLLVLHLFTPYDIP